MVLGEVDLGIGTALLPPIIQVIMVDRLVFVTEAEIGLTPSNFLDITMVDQEIPNQGFLKKLLQGVCMQKISIKVILIILIQAFQHNLIQAYHHILITTCHLIFIQALHHTKFINVHIELLILRMHLI